MSYRHSHRKEWLFPGINPHFLDVWMKTSKISALAKLAHFTLKASQHSCPDGQASGLTEELGDKYIIITKQHKKLKLNSCVNRMTRNFQHLMMLPCELFSRHIPAVY